MNPNQQNLLELAKQGNTRAIAALINRSLQSKGITSKVSLKGSCLQVLVESDESLPQEPITQSLVGGIKKLNIESINSIKIFGRQKGQDSPAWTHDALLRSSSKESETQGSSLASTLSISEKPQIPNISSAVESDNSALKQTSQDPRDYSKEDVWAKSKAITFSALKSAWKWYLSGFKSRPELPLFLSPRLYRIIFTFFIFTWITTPLGWYESTTSSTSSSSRSSSLSSSCNSAGGTIWTNIRLYQDAGCNRPFGTVVGGGSLRNGERGVLIQFDTGELEWKTRSAVMSQTYVRTDDPARSARLWRDIDQ